MTSPTLKFSAKPDLTVGTEAEELVDLANRFGSDKGTLHFERHGYTRIYDALFEPLKHQPLRILEIGLLHSQDKRWKDHPWRHLTRARGEAAPSLSMWSCYFSRAQIYGFDINDFSAVALPRTTILQGDMGSPADLDRLVRDTGGAFDIIIDDASHCSHHQQQALARLFRELNPGGLYIVEDLHWQNPLWEAADAVKTATLLQAIDRGRPLSTPDFDDAARAGIEAELAEISFYDSLEPGAVFRGRDALAVFRKR